MFQRRLRYIYQILVLLLIPIGTTSCQDDVKWVYIVPDSYTGWLTIHYECSGGQPLIRDGDTIIVPFNQDGVFCASDKSFPWQGEQIAYSSNGNLIPIVIFDITTTTGYGMCCFQTTRHGGSAFPDDILLDISWVGSIQNRPLGIPLDAIREDALDGRLVPADW